MTLKALLASAEHAFGARVWELTKLKNIKKQTRLIE